MALDPSAHLAEAGAGFTEALRAFATGLVERFPTDVLEVRLFGSRARGDAAEDSDVDLLVVLRDAAPEDINDAIGKAAREVWRDGLPLLAPLVLREAEFRRYQSTRCLLYRDLRDQGIALWQGSVDLWNEEGVPAVGRERDVEFELKRARNSLKMARLGREQDLPDEAASRAYYAAFQAASAALLTRNIERAKHQGLISEFNHCALHNQLLGKEFHLKLDDLFKLRQEADYGRDGIREKDARRAIDTAERFVQAAQEYCRKWSEQQAQADR